MYLYSNLGLTLSVQWNCFSQGHCQLNRPPITSWHLFRVINIYNCKIIKDILSFTLDWNKIILLKDITRMFDKCCLWSCLNILSESIRWHIITFLFISPLKVKPEVIGNVILEVQFVNCQTICSIHGQSCSKYPLRSLPSNQILLSKIIIKHF